MEIIYTLKNIDRYIQIMQLKSEKMDIKNYKGMTVLKSLEKYIGKKG